MRYTNIGKNSGGGNQLSHYKPGSFHQGRQKIGLYDK